MGAGSIAGLDAPAGVLLRLGAVARERPIASALVCLVLVSLVFVFLPGIDLAVSRLFHQPGKGFVGEDTASVELIGILASHSNGHSRSGSACRCSRRSSSRGADFLIRPRSIAFVLATFALGPGLIVNGVLKDYWGRARPREILEFGGGSSFSPAWLLSDECLRNCSFVSGEAASGFFLITAVFLVNRTLRPIVACVAIAIAGAISLARIAGGGHFLSDVLIAWLVVLLVIAVLHRLVLGRLPPTFDDRVEAAIGSAGRALRALFGCARPCHPKTQMMRSTRALPRSERVDNRSFSLPRKSRNRGPTRGRGARDRSLVFSLILL